MAVKAKATVTLVRVNDGAKGETGAAGVGISSIQEYYAVSSSNSTAPTSWSTTVQTMTSTNKYLWNYERITFTNSTTKDTAKRVIGIYGDKGATGATGATGKGIKSITNYYLTTASSSGVTTSTSGWTTSVQNVSASKKYLWNYEVITFTDNSTNTVSPSIIGAYGDKGDKGETGAAGKGVKSSAVTYQASTSGTTVPTGTWSTSIPSVSAGQYLWTRTVITYTDNATSTSYSVGMMGARGATGSAGKGIKSTAITYQAGSSGTSAPTGTWSSSVPATSASASYLWSRTIITYTDNTTSTTYSVGSTPEGIEVGGRNYFIFRDITKRNAPDVNIYERTKTGYKITIKTLSTFPQVYCDLSSGAEGIYRFESGQKYLLHYDVSGTGDVTKANIFVVFVKDSTTVLMVRLDGGGAKKFTAPDQSKYNRLQIIVRARQDVDNATIGDIIEFSNIKIEKGNKATDWSLAPEDIATGEELTSAQEFLSGSIGSLSDQVMDINSSLHDNIDNTNTALQLISSNETKIAELIQQSDAFEFNFNTITTTVTQLNDKLYTETDERLKYIKFIDGEIWLGKEAASNENDFKVVISNERVRFLQNNVEVAYLSNNKLYITDAHITGSLRIGNYMFIQRSNGNLGIRWVN